MADFPRTLTLASGKTILPFEVTDLDVPGPFITKAQSGHVSTRASNQVGRTWEERFLLKVSDQGAKEFLATVRLYWQRGTVFNINHRDYLTPNGAGGGSPLVDGASQTGATINIKGGPLTQTDWLKAGDLISIVGIDFVLDVTADVDTDGAGDATIPINPPIPTGGSPADSAVVTITGVTMAAVILEPPLFPRTGPNDYGELTLRFSEAV